MEPKIHVIKEILSTDLVHGSSRSAAALEAVLGERVDGARWRGQPCHKTVIGRCLTALMEIIWILLDSFALTVAAALMYRTPDAKRAAKVARRPWFAGD
jgi:hypothetical protein